MSLSPSCPLTRANSFLAARTPGWLLAVLVFAGAMAVYAVPVAVLPVLQGVPEWGDGPDYDCIGLALARGKGFAVDWEDPEFRQPYLDLNKGIIDCSYVGGHGAYPTAYRPPLFPLLIGGIYKVVGRQFVAVRLVNCVFMATACVLAALFVFRRYGPLPVLLFTVLFAVVDPRTGWFGRAYYTESLASLCTMLVVWELFWLAEARRGLPLPSRLRRAGVLGLTAGAAMLVRTPFTLWFVLLAPVVYLLAEPGWNSLWGRNRWCCLATFLIAGCLVALPWWVRNVVLLEAPMPFGTQSDTESYAGFSDEAMEHRGVWFTARPFSPPEGVVGLQREKYMAAASRSRALAWLRTHFAQLPLLTAWKAYDLWFGADNGQSLLLIVLAIIGLLVHAWPLERNVCLAVLVVNTFMVSLMASCGGRYLVPVLPVLYALVAIGIWAILVCLIDGRNWMRPLVFGFKDARSDSPMPAGVESRVRLL